MIDTDAYEAVIDEFNTFMTDVSTGCDDIDSAAQDCVDNTEEDNNAETLQGKINKCTGDIKEACEEIQKVIQALQSELDEALGTQNVVDSDD